jgi:hypothetical protein
VVQTKEKETLEGDISKFIKYRDDILNPKLAKSKKGLERLRATIVESRDELRRLETERKELDGQVSAQEMSSEEFDRMSAERDTLQRQLQEIATTNEQAAREAWKLEMEVTKWQEGVEERFKNFNLLATTVDVLPLRLSNGEELVELEIVPRNPTTMLRSGVDMKHVVKPRINDVRNHAQQRFRELSDKKLEVEEDMTGVDEVLGALSEEVTQLEAHTTRQKKSLEETQNVSLARLQPLRHVLTPGTQVSADEARLFAADIMEQERAVQDAEQAGYRAVQYAEAKLAALHRQCVFASQTQRLSLLTRFPQIQAGAGERQALPRQAGKGGRARRRRAREHEGVDAARRRHALRRRRAGMPRLIAASSVMCRCPLTCSVCHCLYLLCLLPTHAPSLRYYLPLYRRVPGRLYLIDTSHATDHCVTFAA